MVLESLANLNKFIMKFRDALHLSNTQYSTLQVAIEQDFDPGAILRDIAGIELVSGMSIIVGVLLVWIAPLGAAAAVVNGVSVFKEIFTGATRSLTNSLQASDVSLTNLAEEEGFVHSFFGTNLKELEDMNVNLFGKGKYKSSDDTDQVSIQDLFSDGTWVDYTEIPALNTDTAKTIATSQQISDWLFKVVLAQIVSNIWKKQGTWISAIPMTKDEFNDNKPGNGDSRLKWWKDGMGYFLQRVTPKKSGIFSDYISELPTFWGDMGDKYGIVPWDALESSVEAYLAGGYDFKPESLLSEIFDGAGVEQMNKGAKYPGLWTLPVCDLTTVLDKDKTLEEWMKFIADRDWNLLSGSKTSGYVVSFQLFARLIG